MKSGGSLVLLLGCHLTQSLPGLFLLCSLPQLLSAAAEGSLESSPAKRFRGASPHQLISCAKEPSVAGSFARVALINSTFMSASRIAAVFFEFVAAGLPRGSASCYLGLSAQSA